MRIKPAPDDLLGRVAIGMNLVPLPGAYALHGMTAGRVLGTAQRLGIFARLLRVYITGQFEIARLSAQEVAKAIRLADEPTALLDVAGAHGWFSAELCKRHETLKATVIDLPGSARVGREIIARAGMSDRVEHREGDMFEDELAGYTAATGFSAPRRTKIRRIPDQDLHLFTAVRAGAVGTSREEQ